MSSIFEFILNLPPWLVLVCAFLFPALEASAFVGVVVPGEIGVVLAGVVANQGKLPARLLDKRKMENAKDALRRHGGKSVFFGRFTAALRALIPGAAGMSGLPYVKFVFWNALGGSIWATAFVLIGYIAGSQYKSVERFANWIGIALLVGIIGFFVVQHFRGKRQHEHA